ncbi:MAG: hypothetical protein V1720_20405 [bacterium]
MKKTFVILPIVILLFACSKEAPRFELFSPEAFAYSLDSGWELNASVNVKGFVQKEKEETYTAKLSFSTDIVTPNSDTLKAVDYGLRDGTEPEEIMDLKIDVQLQLDSTYIAGKYKIIFFVEDNYSNQKASIEKEFELSAD